MPYREFWKSYNISPANLRGLWLFDSFKSLAAGFITDWTANGGAVVTTGFAPSIVLDAVDDYLSLADNARWDITLALTVIVVCRPNVVDAVFRTALSKGTGAATTTAYQIYRTNASPGVWRAEIGDGVSLDSVDSAVIPVANTMTFIALRYTPSSELAIFVGQGAADLTKNTLGAGIPAALVNVASPLLVGARDDAAARRFWSGDIMVALIYNAAISDADLESLYENIRTTYNF